MSTPDILARLGLLHLEDKPEELKEAVHRAWMLTDNSTEESLKWANERRAKRGEELIDIPKYIAEREALKKKYKESQGG